MSEQRNDPPLRGETPMPANPPARNDPRARPPDPAGTRPKFDPEELRPRGDFRELPAGAPQPDTTDPDAAARAPAGGSYAPDDADERLPGPRDAGSPPAVLLAPAQPPHAPRFQFLFGGFAALGVAAATIALSLALAPASKRALPWSSWKPAGDVDPAVQIAEHVAPEYMRSPGHLLVDVTGGPQQIGGQPVALFVRTSGSKPVQLEEQGVFYQLCGAGPNCSIPGKASIQRGLLVRREALELALYTFRYVSGATQVVVTFPPEPPSSKRGKKGESRSPSSTSSSSSSSSSSEGSALEGLSSGTHVPSRVLLFRPQDLAPELERPLDATLSLIAPSVARVEAAPEAQLVNQLTGRLVYDSTLIPQSQSTPVLLLQQASIGG